jgi:protein-S-isoprenylcysteine O-methyltransferase Ste14
MTKIGERIKNMNNIYVVISIICWVGFWVYWTINNSNQKETKQKPNIWEIVPYRFLWASSFLFLILPKVFHLNFTVLPNTISIGILGDVVSILGLTICIWARKYLADNWSMQLDLKKDHELITTGPYALARHPIYTGFLFLFLGTAITTGTAGGIIGFFVLIVGCFVRIKNEEKLMIKTFGEKYLEYKNKVKALIPYIL